MGGKREDEGKMKEKGEVRGKKRRWEGIGREGRLERKGIE